MVPPWVPGTPPAPPPPAPDPPNPLTPDGDTPNLPAAPPEASPDGDKSSPPNLPAIPPSPALAPAGRFRNARSNFASFASGGNSADMKRGVKNYVRQGYGGASKASARFGGTASTAEAIYGVLGGLSGGQTAPGQATPVASIDPALLQGKSAREVMDAVVEAVRPADGTQDAESERAATRDALTELLTAFPDADFLSLNEEQREMATERFVAIDIFRRMQLDIGKTIQDKAPTAAAGLARLKDVKDYVKETVAAIFRKLKAAGTLLTKGHVSEVVRTAVKDTFEVFEGYLL